MPGGIILRKGRKKNNGSSEKNGHKEPIAKLVHQQWKAKSSHLTFAFETPLVMGERNPYESTMVAKLEEDIQRESDPSDRRWFSRRIFCSSADQRGRRRSESECLRQADQTARARTLIPQS